jgi:hypothetical protein
MKIKLLGLFSLFCLIAYSPVSYSRCSWTTTNTIVAQCGTCWQSTYNSGQNQGTVDLTGNTQCRETVEYCGNRVKSKGCTCTKSPNGSGCTATVVYPSRNTITPVSGTTSKE